MEQYTSEDARRDWRRILNKVDHGEPVGITRYGESLAVVVSADWYATVTAYITATTFTKEAADFYATHEMPGRPVLGHEGD